MPLLDFSEVFGDPDTSDQFTVTRSTETVDGHGRSQTATQTYPDCFGVVTDANGSILVQSEDASTALEYIEIHTMSRLTTGSPILKSDTVTWNNVNYTVKEADNYSRYGAGFMTLRCQLVDLFSRGSDA
jgi:galactose-6-phosphate isomerase